MTDSIHAAIDHGIRTAKPQIKTSVFDGVLARPPQDATDDLPFIALFYRGGKARTIEAVVDQWQVAAYRHWAIWLRHVPEERELRLYTYRDETSPVQRALWSVYENYDPDRHASRRFWTALMVTGGFMLFIKNAVSSGPTPMLGIELTRVNGDEFVATEVFEVPESLAKRLEQHERE